MREKKVISVDCEIPGGYSQHVTFDSRSSLLDADIAVFYPRMAGFQSSRDLYQGKPALDSDRSFQLREAASHWRREVNDAVHAGKTVFVFLDDKHEVFVDTGERRYSGTGRNRHETQIVENFNNYMTLPLDLSFTSSHGREMRLAPTGGLLSDYWKEFGHLSTYKVLIEGERVGKPLIVTRSGSKTVATLFTNKDSGGAIILLPDINMSNRAYSTRGAGGSGWTKSGREFGRKLFNNLVGIDVALRDERNVTPAPDWSTASGFTLSGEDTIKREISDAETQIQLLQEQKGQHRDRLVVLSRPKRLLYEKGIPLEEAVIEGLQVLGFSATSFKDSTSQFDVVFECPEGRFLGEVEGRDNRAINISKLRQLEMNIHEDFDRKDVDTMAKGVLFGNAFRLMPPQDRPEYFTDKCKVAAQRSGTALIRTPDLFRVIQYLSEVSDEAFASDCRRAVFETNGSVVEFPRVPVETEDVDRRLADKKVSKSETS